jgi:phosphatidylglycerol lysyltransferase
MPWLVALSILLLGLIVLYILTLWQARRAEAVYPPVGPFVIVEGSRLHYLRQGTGRPVILLHGSDGFLQDYSEQVVQALADEYEVLAFDRPGHGYSDPPVRERPTPRVQARLLHGALQQLDICKPVLVGHSWSGTLLLVYALEYPDDVSGLVLLAPWVYAPDTRFSPLLRIPQIPWLGSLLVSTLLVLIRRPLIWRNLKQAFWPDPVPLSYARLAQTLWMRWPWQAKLVAQEITSAWTMLPTLHPRYREIVTPVRIVAGSEDHAVIPAQHALRLQRDLPHSELALLPHTGHELPQLRPEAILEAVRHCWMEAAAGQTQEQSSHGLAESPSEDEAFSVDYRRARELVFRYGWNATAYQILNPGMNYWFAEGVEAVVGYVRRQKVRVAVSAPICQANLTAEIAAAFEQEAACAGERVCWFGAAARLQSVLRASPAHSFLTIGAQPVWNPSHWPDILAKNASLRAQLNRARNKGVQVSEWSPERAHNHPDLQRCLEEWIASRPLPPLRFLTEPVALDHLADRRIFVAEVGAAPLGFLIATPIPDRNGWLIEQIIRGRQAPNGTAEQMVDAAMRTLGAEGFEYITLGLAPLADNIGAEPQQYSPWLRFLLAWIRAHGRRFYNFQGLYAFKAKFKPDAWEPLFAIANEPDFSLRTLYAIADAFSAGPPLGMVARALYAAFRQELAWLGDWLRARQA